MALERKELRETAGTSIDASPSTPTKKKEDTQCNASLECYRNDIRMTADGNLLQVA